jgi:CHAD domain-containing protein
MQNDKEIEAKFKIVDRDLEHTLLTGAEITPAYPLSDARQVVDIDTYYDTPAYDLLRRGKAFRVRVHDDEVFLTVKNVGVNAPKGIHVRSEVELPAPDLAADPDVLNLQELPEEIADALSELPRDCREFTPVCRLHQVRNQRYVLRKGRTGKSSQTVAELSLDDVTVLRPDRNGPSSWLPVTQFHEVEIEITDGADRNELKQLAILLHGKPGVEPSYLNKLQQALVAAGQATPPIIELETRQHVAELCRRVWGQQLAQMLINEAGVRESTDIEYVHDMRVATRRARAAARLYAGYFDPKNKQLKRFQRQLRTTGSLLGRVRDMDVALDKLKRFSESVTLSNSEQADDLERLTSYWQRERDKAHRRLLKWLDSTAYSRFVSEFDAFCSTPGEAVPPFVPQPGNPPTPHQVRHVIPSMILARYESIRAFETLFESGVEVPIATLHALRIECKYMRYHLEFNEPILGSHGAELISALKALQEHLGELNDASVTVTMLEDARAHVDGPATAEYLAQQAALIPELAGRLGGDLEAFLSPETRRKLALAIAEI